MANIRSITRFLSKYSPEIAAQLQDARQRLAKHFPRGFELVYDNYNALVFAYSPTERGGDAILSVAGYPKWVTLFFAQGASLEDPAKILTGSGPRFRSIRLQPADLLRRADVQKLIRAAKAAASSELKAAPPLTTIINAVSTKQRARKPAAARTRSRRAAR
ncbi:MAG TPA: hypothetical protein VMF52_20365 [Steroidobacteraceae bacterium]|nr:hypothetical protein [Steroidobacteraceae bacterium]